ncbi:MAG: RDD family protein [Armatimonadetes bacterium]|nr:RDD family protein [Armatimonadota bacterium]
MNDQHMVLTPEKAVVSFRIAGIGGRIIAQIIDLIILAATIVALILISGLFGLVLTPEVAGGFMTFAVSASFFLYFILFEWLWNGLTPGKKASGVRVVSYDGTPITMRGAVYRNLLRPADFLPILYFAGLIATFMNEKSQRLGDLVAGTIVIHEAQLYPQYTTTPHHAGIHPFEESIGQLSTMTMEEYFAIKRLCDRFPELPPSIQVRSVEEIWVPFAEKEQIQPINNVHPVYQMEAVVMKYGRKKKLF